MMRDAVIVELLDVDGQNLVTIPCIYSSIEFNHVMWLHLINAAQKVLSYLKDN